MRAERRPPLSVGALSLSVRLLSPVQNTRPMASLPLIGRFCGWRQWCQTGVGRRQRDLLTELRTAPLLLGFELNQAHYV